MALTAQIGYIVPLITCCS